MQLDKMYGSLPHIVNETVEQSGKSRNWMTLRSRLFPSFHNGYDLELVTGNVSPLI